METIERELDSIIESACESQLSSFDFDDVSMSEKIRMEDNLNKRIDNQVSGAESVEKAFFGRWTQRDLKHFSR